MRGVDFNSHVRDVVDQEDWRQAFLMEIDRAASQLGPRKVTSIFLGGGTPSLMPPATVGALLDRIATRWTIDTDIEINLPNEKIKTLKNKKMIVIHIPDKWINIFYDEDNFLKLLELISKKKI